jgi:HprK-related kinase B
MLNWKRGGGPVRARLVDLAARRELLPAFMKPAGVFYFHAEGAIRNPTEDDYLRVLAGVPVLELSGGVDFHAARGPVMELLAA